MTETLRNSESRAGRRAAQRFARELASCALLRRTARIEAVVHAARAEPVFLLEAALRSAWDRALGGIRLGEITWAANGAQGAPQMQLQAFDAKGQLLLRSVYDAGALS
jgi:hypothetical protein